MLIFYDFLAATHHNHAPAPLSFWTSRQPTLANQRHQRSVCIPLQGVDVKERSKPLHNTGTTSIFPPTNGRFGMFEPTTPPIEPTTPPIKPPLPRPLTPLTPYTKLVSHRRLSGWYKSTDAVPPSAAIIPDRNTGVSVSIRVLPRTRASLAVHKR